MNYQEALREELLFEVFRRLQDTGVPPNHPMHKLVCENMNHGQVLMHTTGKVCEPEHTWSSPCDYRKVHGWALFPRDTKVKDAIELFDRYGAHL